MNPYRNQNGIRRALTRAEAILLAEGNYPCPVGMRLPHGWVLSAAGVPVPPLPQGPEFEREVFVVRATMTAEEFADPANAANNIARWTTYFEERRNQALVSVQGWSRWPAKGTGSAGSDGGAPRGALSSASSTTSRTATSRASSTHEGMTASGIDGAVEASSVGGAAFACGVTDRAGATGVDGACETPIYLFYF